MTAVMTGRKKKMPMDKSRYPANWNKIVEDKKNAVGWKCEVCGKQCRRPGDKEDEEKCSSRWIRRRFA